MAEMTAIIEALHHVKTIQTDCKEIDLWTDSRSSIDAIAAPIIDQPLALEAHDLLLEINKNVQLNLRWVRGHSDNPGNEFADLLARKGRDTPYTGPLPALYAPRGEVKDKIKNYCRRVWEREWGRQTKYLHSRQVLPRPNLKEIIKGPGPRAGSAVDKAALRTAQKSTSSETSIVCIMNYAIC